MPSRRPALTEPVYYAAYGSNTDPERFARYGADDLSAAEWAERSRWITLDRQMYFAGGSTTWSGPVAFVGTRPEPAHLVHARAYPLSLRGLVTVLRKENGYPDLAWDPRTAAPAVPGDLAVLPVALASDGARGKYNVVLRLPDVEGRPCLTVTTGHVLRLGEPTEDYLAVIRRGLGDKAAGLVVPVPDPERPDNRGMLGLAAMPWSWVGVLGRGAAVGFACVTLPAQVGGAGEREWSLRLGGVVTATGTTAPTWVRFVPGAAPLMTPDLADRLGQGQVTVHADLPVRARRWMGARGDIPAPEVLHVSPALAEALGPWALAGTPHLSGPVRVLARPSLSLNQVRVAYAARTILGLEPGERMTLAPLAPETVDPRGSGRPLRLVAAVARRVAVGVGAWFVGAPRVALRATEGLVGDDGLDVVRVDPSALDFLGIPAGAGGVLIWGRRQTRVRVLVHTPETAARMDEQLREATGMQSREAVVDAERRLKVPVHLRVAVSFSVRDRLGIPPDTIVLLRRNIGHAMLRGASNHILPIAGLCVGVLAVPGVPWWVWAGAAALTVWLTLASVRVR